MAFRYGRGAERDLKEPYRLFARTLSAALSDVRRDRDRGSAKLSSHHAMIGSRKALRREVDRYRELSRTLPNSKPSEIVHAKRVRSSRGRVRTLATLAQAFGRT
jgi:hypothetical protein